MKKLTACLSFCLMISLLAFSQRSTHLYGQITDAAARPVPGASIYIANTQFGAVTDSAGQFVIKWVPEGRYTIRVSAIGYATVIKEDVPIDIQGGKWKLTLLSASRELDAVLVSAQKKEEGLQR